jgi:hypothetical protein
MIWNDYYSNHEVDHTVTLIVGFALAAFVAWAQNELEDQTGKALLAPTDRVVGDVQLNTGLGAKQAH